MKRLIPMRRPLLALTAAGKGLISIAQAAKCCSSQAI